MSNRARPWEKWYSEEAKQFDPRRALKHQSIPATVRDAATRFGDMSAFTLMLPQGQSATISYKALNEHSDAFARYCVDVLKIEKSDVVAIQAPNCLGYLVALVGALKAGAIISNVNPLYTAEETERQLRDSDAKALVGFDLFGEQLDKVVASGVQLPIVTMSAFDFFSPVQRAILSFVAKHFKGMKSSMKTPSTTLMEALKVGAASSTDVSAREITADNPCFYQYSGGTTGKSKGVMLTANGVLINIAQFEAMSPEATDARGKVGLLVLPLYHMFGLYMATITIQYGGQMVLIPNPRPLSNLKKALEKYPPDIFPGVNTLFAGLLAQPWFRENPPTIERTFSGATALKESVRKEWEEVTGAEVVESYGMTETTTVLTTNPTGEMNRPNTVGLPMPGVDIRLVNESGQEVPTGERGEIQAKGPQIMMGYLNADDLNQQAFDDGWLRTGDIGVFDDDGFLRIVDRVKDMVLISGFNVFPNEIEGVITKMPGVSEVGVVGRADGDSGEALVAFVVRSDETLTEEAVIAYCREHLTGYKCPKDVRFVDELPKTPVGKVLRRELREMAA